MMYCISVTLYAEFLPCKQRAKCVVLLDVSLGIHFAFVINNEFVIITYILHVIEGDTSSIFYII